MSQRCVLVTGATGFIGRALCVKMLECGWKVRIFCRKNTAIEVLPAGVECVRISSIEDGDFKEEAFLGVDTIVHLAARVHISKGADIEAFRRVNVLGTERLAKTASGMNVKRFVFISSVKVNGEGAANAYREDDIPDPKDAYALSKREAEDILKTIAFQTGLEVVILRFPLIYGPDAKANFRDLVKAVRCGLPLPLKNANNLRSFIYLGNAIDAILTSVIHPKAAGEVFFVSDGQDVSTAELIRMIARAMNKTTVLFSLNPVILNFLGCLFAKRQEIQKLTATLIVDSSKIRHLLDWNPSYTIEEGLRATINVSRRV